MKVTGELRSWLPWVIKIRFAIIIFVFAIAFAIEEISPSPTGFHSIVNLGGLLELAHLHALFSDFPALWTCCT